MVFAREPAVTAEGVSTRPRPTPTPADGSHQFVRVDEPRRAGTLAKIAGLIVISALSVPLCAAILAGGAALAIMTLR